MPVNLLVAASGHVRRHPHPVADRSRRSQAAAEQLLPLVYDELRKLAAAKLAQEKPGQTLQATALVHEAYLRLVGDGQEPQIGTAGAISLPRRPRRCGGSSSRMHDGKAVPKQAAGTPASN